MSFLSVSPEIVSAASRSLENLGSALRSANAAAASQTTAVAAPAADEVSAAITALFGAHAYEFQTLSAKAAAFHDEFVNLLNGGAAQYVSAEAGNVQRTLINALGTPFQALLGHSAVAADTNSTGGTTGSGPAGIDLKYPFGPFELSLTETNVSLSAGGFAGFGNVSLDLNTPFGSAVLLSGGVSQSVLPNGSFELTINQTAPFLYANGVVTGVLNPTTSSPEVTGLTVILDDLQLSWPGTLGGVIPNAGLSPALSTPFQALLGRAAADAADTVHTTATV